jgi:hypothetical protein
MPMAEPESFELRRDSGDVLLFRRGADGTIALLAVTEDEWRRAVAAEGPEAPPLVAARRLFEDTDVTTTSAGGSSGRR